MASKGPRSKLDHETRAKRQKALEPPKEPQRPKTHWDHVLEEMAWLSKDFESERKWKLALAKKVAIRASKGMVDQATRGERKVKEEEQRLKKVALNISKDVKKFWIKIEKLVLYKHQLEVDEKKKKALDKQLEFLLGQTERYSTMLAENLVDSSVPCVPMQSVPGRELQDIQYKDQTGVNGCSEPIVESQPNNSEDEEYVSDDESEDDEHTLEEDEAIITAEERREELVALHNEVDMPLDEILRRYAVGNASRDGCLEKEEDIAEHGQSKEKEDDSRGKESNISVDNNLERHHSPPFSGRRCVENNGDLLVSENINHISEVKAQNIRDSSKAFREGTKSHFVYDFDDEDEDGDFVLANGEEKDDETTLLEEEELSKGEPNDGRDEIAILQKESELSMEELLARYKKDTMGDNIVEDDLDSEYASASEDSYDFPAQNGVELNLQSASADAHDMSTEQRPIATISSQEQEEMPNQISEEGGENENIIADAAAAARSAQPTGNTFLTTKVRTKYPFLLKFSLREYQHIGLDWLVTMYEKRLNGILADEMGLGKTIMTIALLGHLACEKGIWGPHLIVVPTSVMLNWETEFLKWCPAFKILTYFGSAKERKIKRQGWLKPNSFHVCITTYRLVIQDSKVFKRKKWKYLILDEAHLIKNWKSQRWQTLLNFNTKRRILLTGTPLQNDLMELWSLMHFLMPHIFQSHQEFKDWFSNPISGMVDGQEKVNKEVVDRLHNVLRPFILRRLKRDVEKQLPMKHEHVIYCRLSRRQRNLYEDFIASSETQATLASANFFGMISVIMQLRKVCNHPDLFEGRPIVSSFDMNGIDIQLSSSVCSILTFSPFSTVDLCGLGFVFTHLDFDMNSWESDEVQAIATPSSLIEEHIEEVRTKNKFGKKLEGFNIFEEIQKALLEERRNEAKERAAAIAWWNSLRCRRKPMYSTSLSDVVSVKLLLSEIHHQQLETSPYMNSSVLDGIVLSPVQRFQKMVDQVESFMFAIPAARAPIPVCWCSKTGVSVFMDQSYKERCSVLLSPLLAPIRPAIVRRQVYFPDRRLIQFDCGKLQELAVLLRKLKSEGHRALIFTQMTKMLDVLEAFINLYGYTYMRLDGSTQPEQRQTLMQRFNTNPKIFLFILSTRSGGVGINLVGADTVIFYDSDWNPAMDQQAQDRCHRIGQTREVHIYRLISESTIEENILKKAKQKRALDDLVIQSGDYSTEFFKKLDPMELFSGHRAIPETNVQREPMCTNGVEVSVSTADVEAALKYAEDEADYMALKKVEQEEAVDNQEFTEEATERLEDDDLINEEDLKADDSADHGAMVAVSNKDNVQILHVGDSKEEKMTNFVGMDDDVDMLDDVKQMAAAAAASGEAILSFENQLRPIDRYAIRFLEIWDPIIDKAAMESQNAFEESEWELDHIEKLKEDMEAEDDDDDEPLVYERWDSEFATLAYRQQVEALAQHQLMEERELEAREKEQADCDSLKNEATNMPKLKKKPKKSKFKSLKKEALASEEKALSIESPIESMSQDDEVVNLEVISSSTRVLLKSNMLKKRKATSDVNEVKTERKPKKFKKTPELCPLDLTSNSLGKQPDEAKDSKLPGTVIDLEHKPTSRNKTGVKIPFPLVPVKRVLTIRLEKLKKGSIWFKDCFPSPDSWLPSEDAVLCAVVHEYGPHWSLVSDVLYGIIAGGFHRGIFRHPVHCCERYRELVQRYVLSSVDNLHNEKSSNAGPMKSLLKVTEENARLLLDIVSELPDQEPIIQRHFFSLLSSVWRATNHRDHRQSLSSSQSGKLLTSAIKQISPDSLWSESAKMEFTNLSQTSRLVAGALHDAYNVRTDDRVSVFRHREDAPAVADELRVTLEIPSIRDDQMTPLPSVVNLSIFGPESLPSAHMHTGEEHQLRSSHENAENRFRDASRASTESSLEWASLAFPIGDIKSRTPVKSQFLGKHKLPVPEAVWKHSKSKLRKAIQDSSDTHSVLRDADFQSTMRGSRDSCLRSDIATSSISGAGMEDLFSAAWEMSNGFVSETDTLGIIPHNYDPGSVLGLEDCSLLPEFTDIG